MNRLKLSKLSEFLSSSGSKFQTVGPAQWNLPTAVRAESTARHNEMVPAGRSQKTTARSSIRSWDEVISEVARCPSAQTPVHHHIPAVAFLNCIDTVVHVSMDNIIVRQQDVIFRENSRNIKVHFCYATPDHSQKYKQSILSKNRSSRKTAIHNQSRLSSIDYSHHHHHHLILKHMKE